MRQKIRKGILTLSALLFPLFFLFFSPFIIVVAASRGIVSASAITFTVLLLCSMVGSRLFCGWLCPAGSIQDQVSNSNSKLWNSKAKNISKYVFWAVWLSFILFLWMRHLPLEINLLYLCGINLHILTVYFIVATSIYLFALLTGKRGMCHSLCWMAPFMVIGEKVADFLHLPRFRLEADSAACISCGQCNKKCPMSLDVSKMIKNNCVDSAECIYCLECADVCPKSAIQCGIKGKSKRHTSIR
ncbi:4Fe-4S binding protein [Clostridium aminobutyricum]|uniref:4Fe-4S binding protein n=1 Tax=Clostridium aminobutyricum TaxID=33953 RepID=A0A939D651_CLOAM|nr:4Fe-4S binding protein [Clostridium aminobutyricum]MBN7771756.1 4Fe-4S binding protein [Clostridium aminobutyricum]